MTAEQEQEPSKYPPDIPAPQFVGWCREGFWNEQGVLLVGKNGYPVGTPIPRRRKS